MCLKRRAHGLSLIELVVFIVVLGIGLAGTLVVYNQATRASVDPLVRKQALAIAASLLEEIELRGFTYCDPDDANVYTATVASTSAPAGEVPCASTPEAMGLEPGEAAAQSRKKFDNVNDYNGLSMSGFKDIQGNDVAGLEQYQASVGISLAGDSLGGLISNEDALLVAVTVTGPGEVRLTLHGYRIRYAPNSP